jgi:hypothetical protein
MIGRGSVDKVPMVVEVSVMVELDEEGPGMARPVGECFFVGAIVIKRLSGISRWRRLIYRTGGCVCEVVAQRACYDDLHHLRARSSSNA